MKQHPYLTPSKSSTLLTIATLSATSATMLTAQAQEPATDQSEEVIQQIEEFTLVGTEAIKSEDWYEGNEPIVTPSFLSLTQKETPQSLTVITEEQISDFGLTDINQVLTYTPGVTVEPVETDRTYFTARGFDITNFQVDGLGVPLISGNMFGNMDSAMYERVEVLRGANGLTSGTGNPSATINMVRKRPTTEWQGTIQATAGSWDNQRYMADVGGAVVEDGSVRARAVVVSETADSYLDRYEKDNALFYGVVEADLTERTLLTAGYSYEENKANSPMWGALPVTYSDGSETDYGRSTSTSSDWSYWDNEVNTSFIRLDQQLGDNWTAQAQFSYIKSESRSKLFYLYGLPDATTGLGLYSYPSRYEADSEQYLGNFQLNGNVELFDRVHEVVAGYSYSKYTMEDRSDYGQGIGTAITVPLGSWDGNYPEPSFDAFSNGSDWTDEENSVFAAVRLNPADDWKILLGSRFTHVDSHGDAYGASKDATEDKFIPYAGVVYKITDALSAYASYTEIFSPQAELDVNNNRLNPAEGSSYEVGLKSDLFGGRAYASASLFYIEQDDIAEYAGTHIDGRGYYQSENLKSQGFETEIVGEIMNGLNVAAGYTFLEVLDDVDNHVRKYTPKHSVKLSSTYDIPNTNLRVGAAARWQSETKGGGATQSDYVIVDLMAKYQISDNWSASVNAYNITDEKYYNSLYWDQAYYGSPRNYSVSVAYAF